MSHFITHTSCPKCGSSDARGLYSDGGWFCFSCKASSKGSYVKQREYGNIPPVENKQLPDNISTHFQGKAVEWLTKYGFSIEDLIKHGVRYSNNWVYFTWPDTDIWQGRNMDVKRYYTSGNHDSTLLLYYCGKDVDRCVLTEDSLSAIKIASAGVLGGLWSDAMPLLGTHLPAMKMKGLKRLYSQVDVFLDHDKGATAMRLSTRLQLLGIKSHVYIDKRDPKEIPYEELRSMLL